MSNHSFGLPFHIAQRTYAVPKLLSNQCEQQNLYASIYADEG